MIVFFCPFIPSYIRSFLVGNSIIITNDGYLHVHSDFLTAPNRLYEYLKPSRTLCCKVLYVHRDYDLLLAPPYEAPWLQSLTSRSYRNRFEHLNQISSSLHIKNTKKHKHNENSITISKPGFKGKLPIRLAAQNPNSLQSSRSKDSENFQLRISFDGQK